MDASPVGSYLTKEVGAGQRTRRRQERRGRERPGQERQIYTGALGGQPWEIPGTTFEVAGLVRADVEISGEGLDVKVRADGIGDATGRYLANPVTGERHEAHIVLPTGFIWTDGACGIGTFAAAAEGLDLSFQDSNWILYDFDWSNS